MTDAEKKLLADAIETAIRAEREKIVYKKWAMFFGIFSVICMAEIIGLMLR